MSITYDFGVGGFDLSFEVSLTGSQFVKVFSSCGIGYYDAVENKANAKTYIKISPETSGSTAALYEFTLMNSRADVIDYYATELDSLGKIRITFHNEFISIYIDDYWIHTFAVDFVYHPEIQNVGLVASESITVNNVLLRELSDWREAIPIDMETTTRNLISSLIMQRPLDVFQRWNGALVFDYDAPKQTVTVPYIKSDVFDDQEDANSCSDAIVYFTFAGVSIDTNFLNRDGFVTRMYRFPDLDNGAIRASRLLQQKSRQKSRTFTGVGRLSPKLEIGDIASITYSLPNGRGISRSLIVESISLSIRDGEQSTTIRGRDYYA